jgi:hypothetical protein
MIGDKGKYNFYLSTGIMRRFKDMAYLKHGAIYGALSSELEAAMNQRIVDFRNGGSTHTHFAPKAVDLKNRLIGWLKEKYKFENLDGIRIAKPMLVEAIIAVEGVTDSRPINDRIKLLKSTNCIKESEDSNKLNKRYIFVLDSDYLKKEEKIQ